jgi:hypothetical protein
LASAQDGRLDAGSCGLNNDPRHRMVVVMATVDYLVCDTITVAD